VGPLQSLNTKLFSQPWNARAHSGRTRYRQQTFPGPIVRPDATHRLLSRRTSTFRNVEVQSTWVPIRTAHIVFVCVGVCRALPVRRCASKKSCHSPPVASKDAGVSPVFISTMDTSLLSVLEDTSVPVAPNLSKRFASPGTRCCIHRPSCLGITDHPFIASRDLAR
jgi:hypothetical protein